MGTLCPFCQHFKTQQRTNCHGSPFRVTDPGFSGCVGRQPIITVRKRSLRRLCFHRCFVCPPTPTYGNEGAVHILLECILVWRIFFCESFMKFKEIEPRFSRRALSWIHTLTHSRNSLWKDGLDYRAFCMILE